MERLTPKEMISSAHGTGLQSQEIAECVNGTGSLTFADEIVTTFDLTLIVSDSVNQPSEWVIPVELYNEMPNASFETTRPGNLSEDIVTLTSTTIDPEGDQITYLWESNLDGVLSNQSSWQGYLSRGTHVITLSVNDGRMEHVNSTSIASETLLVKNSPPKAVISSPAIGDEHDSSHLFEFNASGSGDYDSACETFPANIDWHCSGFEPASGSEYLIYRWESDIDGILQEDGSDWLIFETHLSNGLHTITLTLDDGINPQVSESMMINVDPSAPVLVLNSPDIERGYLSSEIIELDLRDSVDYDGDLFSSIVKRHFWRNTSQFQPLSYINFNLRLESMN